MAGYYDAIPSIPTSWLVRASVGRMHDDLIDVLDWTIAEGYADPDRVAIYGSSCVAYAALIGASFTPDRFAAAIDYAGGG